MKAGGSGLAGGPVRRGAAGGPAGGEPALHVATRGPPPVAGRRPRQQAGLRSQLMRQMDASALDQDARVIMAEAAAEAAEARAQARAGAAGRTGSGGGEGVGEGAGPAAGRAGPLAGGGGPVPVSPPSPKAAARTGDDVVWEEMI